MLHCVDGMAGRACALIRLQIVCIMHIYTCTTKLVGLYRAVQCTVHVLICKDIHEICTQCLPTPLIFVSLRYKVLVKLRNC